MNIWLSIIPLINVLITICYLIMFSVVAAKMESGHWKGVAIAACVLAWLSEVLGFVTKIAIGEYSEKNEK